MNYNDDINLLYENLNEILFIIYFLYKIFFLLLIDSTNINDLINSEKNYESISRITGIHVVFTYDNSYLVYHNDYNCSNFI